MGKTLAEKVWDAHVVRAVDGEPDLLYIDLHLVHEVTSPQAFEGLRMNGRRVRRPDSCLEVASPFACEGGRGVWYLPADTAASPGPSGANCRAWVVVPCAARSERRDGRGVSR